MGLLREMFQREDRPGPGVGPDEPRKKGLRRLWEVCTRDLMGLFWAGLIALLGMAPWAVLTGWTMQARSLAAVALAGALGGLIAAPELCALADLILRGLRDEPFYGWDAWRRAWKGSLRSCLLPGAVLGLLAALDCFVIRIVLTGSSAPGALLGAAAGLFLLAGFIPHLLAQLALFEQPLGRSVKNSFLLLLACLPRSLGAAAILLGYVVLTALFQPFSYFVLILASLWLPMAAALLAIYKPMEQILDLEKQIRAVHEERRGRQ